MSDTQDIGQLCARWWAELTNAEIGRSRAELAQLRRASTPVEALINRATHRLNRRLDAAGQDLRHQPERLALIVLCLAHVKTGAKLRLAQVMGQGEPPALSPMRFDKLIRCETPEDLTRPLRRALAQVNHQANVAALARDLMWWNDTTRARWCFDYYGAPGAAPDPGTDQEFIEETRV